jgi:hypothetical protein
MRHTMTMQPIWVEGIRVDKPVRREPVVGLGRRIWMLGWGLGFVILMTVLSEWGPPAAYSKIPAAPAISEQSVHAVK